MNSLKKDITDVILHIIKIHLIIIFFVIFTILAYIICISLEIPVNISKAIAGYLLSIAIVTTMIIGVIRGWITNV